MAPFFCHPWKALEPEVVAYLAEHQRTQQDSPGIPLRELARMLKGRARQSLVAAAARRAGRRAHRQLRFTAHVREHDRATIVRASGEPRSLEMSLGAFIPVRCYLR